MAGGGQSLQKGARGLGQRGVPNPGDPLSRLGSLSQPGKQRVHPPPGVPRPVPTALAAIPGVRWVLWGHQLIRSVNPNRGTKLRRCAGVGLCTLGVRRKWVFLQVPDEVVVPSPSPCPLRRSPSLLPAQRPQPAPRLSPRLSPRPPLPPPAP